MAVEGLEQFSKEDLIGELINRQTFVGIVVYHRGDAKDGKLEAGEVVVTRSPPLTATGVQDLLDAAQSVMPQLFPIDAISPANAHQGLPPFREGILRWDLGEVVRVGNGRISLDLIVEQYLNGMTPEDMVLAYDTLSLADVYAAIGYYLRHAAEVNEYRARRNEEAGELRKQIEARQPRLTREELLMRQQRREQSSVAAR